MFSMLFRNFVVQHVTIDFLGTHALYDSSSGPMERVAHFSRNVLFLS